MSGTEAGLGYPGSGHGAAEVEAFVGGRFVEFGEFGATG